MADEARSPQALAVGRFTTRRSFGSEAATKCLREVRAYASPEWSRNP